MCSSPDHSQIHFAIQTNMFCHWDKYIWLFRQIHLDIQTNAFDNLDNYILQFGQYARLRITVKYMEPARRQDRLQILICLIRFADYIKTPDVQISAVLCIYLCCLGCEINTEIPKISSRGHLIGCQKLIIRLSAWCIYIGF